MRLTNQNPLRTQMALVPRQIWLRAALAGPRLFSYSSRAPFITDFFKDRKTLQQRNELIAEKQRDEADATTHKTKIVILNEENSPNHKPFDVETDMPGFKVEQWKLKLVAPQHIEELYLPESVSEIVAQAFQLVNGSSPLVKDFESVVLDDLDVRFKLCKQVQHTLGFDVSDYVFSRSHTLAHLKAELQAIVSKRWTNERNPNAIALRPEDFTAGNVYLNQEKDAYEQEQTYQKLLREAEANT
jgi:hypothetical protein